MGDSDGENIGLTIRVHQNLFSNKRLYYRGGCST